MPRRRTVVRFVLLLGAVLAGYVLFESFRLSRSDPVIAVDHHEAIRTRAIAMSGVDPDAAADAWDALMRAFDLHDAVIDEIVAGAERDEAPARGDWDVGRVDYSFVIAGDGIPERATREREALRLFSERGGDDALAVFARATTAMGPLPARPPGATVLNPVNQAVFPELPRARHLAQALAARMRIAHEEGDPAEVAATFDRLLALARTMSYQPGLIGHLVGRAILDVAIDELTHELTEADLGEALCRRLLDTLDRRTLAPIELAIETERSAFLDLVQHQFTDDGNGNGYLAEGNVAAAALARFLGPRRAKVLAAADAYFDGYADTARMPAAQRATRGFDRGVFIVGLGSSPSHRFVRVLLPDLSPILEQVDHPASHMEGARLLLAIEIHMARHGTPPARLADLAPAILPRIPDDPLRGGVFGYRRVGTDVNANGFLLYSCGADGRDDGGTVSPMGAREAYFEEGAGFDVLINRPRDEWPD